MSQFFDYIEINFAALQTQVTTWLTNVYNKAGILFNSASPYGQLLTVIAELFTHNILYLKNAINQINIQDTVDPKMINFIARIAGHNPSRAISASGTLQFSLNAGINLIDTFGNNSPSIVIENWGSLQNNTNSLYYVFDLGGNESQTFSIQPNTVFYVNVLQGQWETQEYTGTGDSLQTLSVNVTNQQSIDNFNYQVLYNGQILNIEEHLWDMLPGEMACWTRTGFNGGMDIYFGTDNFGFIPGIGSLITVNYLVTNGTSGDIFNYTANDWKIIGNIYDVNGNLIDVSKIFTISIATDIDFSSDGESPTYTKTIVPQVSRNFVLASPPQFVYQLEKLNMFSKVNAYNTLPNNNVVDITPDQIQSSITKLGTMIKQSTKYTPTLLYNQYLNVDSLYKQYIVQQSNDNQIYLYVIPKIDQYLDNVTNYFNVPLNVFFLNDIDEAKILKFLNQQGIVFMNTEIVIIQPNITKYIMYVYLTIFDTDTQTNVSQEILANLATFFLDWTRTDRIVKSDIIQNLKTISSIDSVDVMFVSQANEIYQAANPGQTNTIIGIDPVMGDILIGNDELSIIRGGWKDRNGVYYNDNPTSGGLNSVNIIFNGTTTT